MSFSFDFVAVNRVDVETRLAALTNCPAAIKEFLMAAAIGTELWRAKHKPDVVYRIQVRAYGHLCDGPMSSEPSSAVLAVQAIEG